MRNRERIKSLAVFEFNNQTHQFTMMDLRYNRLTISGNDSFTADSIGEISRFVREIGVLIGKTFEPSRTGRNNEIYKWQIPKNRK